MAGYTGRSPSAYKFAKDWQQQTEIAKAYYLERAAKRIKKWADKERRPAANLKVGDWVLVKLQPVYRKLHKGLIRKYDGPFPCVENGSALLRTEARTTLALRPRAYVCRVGKAAYRVSRRG